MGTNGSFMFTHKKPGVIIISNKLISEQNFQIF